MTQPRDPFVRQAQEAVLAALEDAPSPQQETKPGVQAGPTTLTVTAGGDALVAHGEGAVAMKTYQTTKLREYCCPRCCSSETQAIAARLDAEQPSFNKEGKEVWSAFYRRHRLGLEGPPVVHWPLLPIGCAFPVLGFAAHAALTFPATLLATLPLGIFTWSWVTLDQRMAAWTAARQLVLNGWACKACGHEYTPQAA